MAQHRAVAVIPARYASTRYPGKPLVRETGKPLIQHVVEQVRVAPGISEVIVATDDPRIADAVRGFGGAVQMTRADHCSGTDRVAEVAERLTADIVLNVQGDEPEIEPVSLAQLVEALRDRPHCEMATLACPFDRVPGADPEDPNAVKVHIDDARLALGFSRQNRWHTAPHPLLHLGVYAYRREFLLTFRALAPTPLEQSERLEQMRALENGYRIAVAVVHRAAVGIDTPEDYAGFVRRYRSGTTRPHTRVNKERS